MDNIKQLADEIFRDRVRRARAMSPEEKFLAGPQLFAYACEITKAGIRSQNPDADEAEVRRLLKRRFAIAKRIEEHDLENRRSNHDSL